MKKEEFREWLSEKIKKKPASDCLSRCKSVEHAMQIDLDFEFGKDGGKELLNRMQYSIEDERSGKIPPPEFHFQENANVRYRMANLRSAVNKYFDFCKEIK